LLILLVLFSYYNLDNLYPEANNTVKYNEIKNKYIPDRLADNREYYYSYTIYIDDWRIHPRNEGYMIDINGFDHTIASGGWVIPFKSVIFELPSGSRIISLDVEFRKAKSLYIHLNELYRNKYIMANNRIINIEEKSNTNAGYKIIFNGNFRNYRILQVDIYPIYNQPDGLLSLYREINISLRFTIDYKTNGRILPFSVIDQFITKLNIINITLNHKLLGQNYPEYAIRELEPSY